jgi:hypothetical protein
MRRVGAGDVGKSVDGARGTRIDTGFFPGCAVNISSNALLAAVPEAVPVLQAVPHLPLSHVSLRFCEPDGAADRTSDRSIRDRAAARVSDWAVYPRGGSAVAPEEGRHADHGRGAHPHLGAGADAAVERPLEPERVAGDGVDAGVWSHRIRRRLYQGGPQAQPGADRAAEAGASVPGQRTGGCGAAGDAGPRIVLDQADGAVPQELPAGSGGWAGFRTCTGWRFCHLRSS